LKKYDLQESYNNFKIKFIVSFCESGPWNNGVFFNAREIYFIWKVQQIDFSLCKNPMRKKNCKFSLQFFYFSFVKVTRRKKYRLGYSIFFLLLKVTCRQKYALFFSFSLSQRRKKVEDNFYINIQNLINIHISADNHPIYISLGLWRTTPRSSWLVDHFDWKKYFFWTFQIKDISLAVKNHRIKFTDICLL